MAGTGMAGLAFSKMVAQLGLKKSTPVAIAISGGSDSLALACLAREAFDRVVGITVDHRLREGSRDEAERVGETVRKLGAEHLTLTLDWAERPTPGKTQLQAREKRYAALLRLCREKGLEVMMTAHHHDDQAEGFLMRMAMGSGISGLAGMSPLSHWPGFNDIKIVRPLLQCPKSSLVDVCRSKNVGWFEDPTNSAPTYKRNVIRQALAEQPHLVPAVLGLMETFTAAKTRLDNQVLDAMKSLSMKVSTACGYITLNPDEVRCLSPPIARRILRALIRYVGGGDKDIHFTKQEAIHKVFLDPSTAVVETCGRCVVFALRADSIVVTRSLPARTDRPLTSVKLGETVVWDNRFTITLRPLERTNPRDRPSQHRPTASHESDVDTLLKVASRSAETRTDERQFFVRHMIPTDWALAKRGVRRVRAHALPHERVRGGLPVIVDEDGKVVEIPNFKVVDRSYGVTASVRFEPVTKLSDLLLHPTYIYIYTHK